MWPDDESFDDVVKFNLWFSDVSRGYSSETFVENGLT